MTWQFEPAIAAFLTFGLSLLGALAAMYLVTRTGLFAAEDRRWSWRGWWGRRLERDPASEGRLSPFVAFVATWFVLQLVIASAVDAVLVP
jgi:hypothetical protein